MVFGGITLPVRTRPHSIRQYPSMVSGVAVLLEALAFIIETCSVSQQSWGSAALQLSRTKINSSSTSTVWCGGGAVMLDLLPSKTETRSMHRCVLNVVTWDDVLLGGLLFKNWTLAFFPVPPPALSWGRYATVLHNKDMCPPATPQQNNRGYLLLEVLSSKTQLQPIC